MASSPQGHEIYGNDWPPNFELGQIRPKRKKWLLSQERACSFDWTAAVGRAPYQDCGCAGAVREAVPLRANYHMNGQSEI
jgi:hypothetical protein